VRGIAAASSAEVAIALSAVAFHERGYEAIVALLP
jgi:hypothetical protein